MATHSHHHSTKKPHISGKASVGLGKFREDLHNRDSTGKFADKPGAGDDAPKKGRTAKNQDAAAKSTSPRAPLTASKLNGSYELSIVAKGNPKKGSAAARYALYKEGMTIDDYVKAIEKAGLGDKKQALRDVLWDMKQGWIKSSKPGAKGKGAGAAGAGAAVGAGALGAGATVQAEAVVAKAVAPTVLEAKPAVQVAAEKKLAAPDDAPVDSAVADLKKAVNYETMEFSNDESFKIGLDTGMFATPAAAALLNKHGLPINKVDVASGEHAKAVGEYTGEAYSEINYKLRNNEKLDTSELEISNSLDKAIEKSSFDEDTVLHRFVDSGKFKASLDSAPVGSTVISPAFTSTSLHPGGYMNISEMSEMGASSPVRMRILGRKGANALYLEPGSVNKGEFEVLLPRGAQLRYLGKDASGVYQFEYAAAAKKADLPEIKNLAPADATPVPSSVVAPISGVGFVKTGPQMGSNPGGTYTGPGGDQYYIKTAKSVQHAENELLANALYEKLGVNTLKPEAFNLGGQLATGSKIEKLTPFNPNNPIHIADAQAAYAQHAFLANWDAVGLSYDNLGYVNGKLTMLDGGGALKYRAQGALKQGFGTDVTEMDTLKSPVNPQAQKVFGSISADTIAKSAAPVLALSDKDIDDLVSASVKDAKRAAEFSSILKGRRDDIAQRVASAAKTEAAEKAVAQNLVQKVAETGPPSLKAAAATAAPAVAPAPPTPPTSGTKSKVPLAKGTPVAASTNPDPLPLGTPLSSSTKLHLEVQGNPKISTAAQRFALYKDGMTVQEYVDAVGDKKQALKDLAWDMKQGWISASKPLPAAASPQTSKLADTVVEKLKASPPTPTAPALSQTSAVAAAAASAGVPLSQPAAVKSVVAAAEKAGTIAPGTAVVVPTPSSPTKYDTYKTGTTAMDAASKGGIAPSDPAVYISAVKPGDFASPLLMKQQGAEAGANTGLSPQSNNAGKFIEKAGAEHGPNSVTAFAMSKGKYVGAMSAQVSGEVATITAAGSVKSGSGVPMLDNLIDQAAQKGVTTLQVKTTSPEFYTTHGFKPTAVKDTYALDISAKTVKASAAKAAVGDVPAPTSTPTQKLLDSAGTASISVGTLPPGAKVSQVGSVSVITDAGGHKFDAAGGGGVAALDPKTLAGLSSGGNAKTSVLSAAQQATFKSQVDSKMSSLGTGEGITNSSEFTANLKAKTIIEAQAAANGAKDKIFGYSIGASGQLKGAISGVSAPGSDSIVITDHASLSSGGGTAALQQLVASAQAQGKKELLVKSGMVDYYKAQGFSASVDHNGYLSLKIDPITYKTPQPSSYNYTGLSQPSEVLLKQVIKKGSLANKAPVDVSKYKTISIGTPEYASYKQNNLDQPLTATEKAKTKYYTGSGSSAVNPYLYNDKPLTPDLQTMVSEMDKAIAKTSFKEDHLLWRAVNPEMKNLFAHLEPGDVFAPANYTSTSVKSGVFGSGATGNQKYKETMKIYASKGAKGIAVGDFSNHSSEEETILPRNAPLRFLGVSPEGFYEFEYK